MPKKSRWHWPCRKSNAANTPEVPQCLRAPGASPSRAGISLPERLRSRIDDETNLGSSSPTSSNRASNVTPQTIQHNTSHDEGSLGDHARKKDYWQLAMNQLQEEDSSIRDQVNAVQQAAAAAGNNDFAAQLLHTTQQGQKELESKRWKITIGSREVVLRDRFDRLVKAVTLFKDVGKAVGSVDPVHAGLPLAGFCVLMQIATNDTEQYAAMVTGVEEIVTIIARYSQIEALYHSRENTALKQVFERQLIGLYKLVIRYQISATCYYQRNAMHASERHQELLDLLEGFEKFPMTQKHTGAPSVPSHTHWSVARSINTLFTGRDELLSDLETIARDAVKDSSRHDQCRVVITGIGGQGKSEICVQLAHRVRQAFWGVFWVDVSTASSAESAFLHIASLLQIPAREYGDAVKGLANTQYPWLLVLDNADDPHVDYQRYLPTGPSGVVILTSRNEDCSIHATKKSIILDGLSDPEACKLLIRAAKIPHDQHQTLAGDAREVAAILRSHALALIQAGSFISRGHSTMANYPRVFKQNRQGLLKFHPDDDDDDDDLDLTQWHSSCLPALMEVDADQWNSFRLIEAIDLLKALSLVSTDTHSGFLSVSMHPLVHAWARDRQDSPEQNVSWIMSGCIMAMSQREDDFWLQYGRQLRPHLHAFVAWDTSELFVRYPHKKITSILLKCGWLLCDMQDSTKVYHLMQGLFGNLGLDLNIVNGEWLELYELTARNLRYYGTANEAALLLDQISRIQEQTHAEDHPNRLSVQHQLAIAHQDNGRNEEAIALLKHVVQIREKTLNEDQYSRLSSQHELARAYMANGQIEEAIIIMEQVVEIRDRILREDHPDRLTSQHELARAYRENGQSRKAVILLEKVVKIEKQTLREDHPDRLTSEYNLARAYKANGQIEEATTLLERVVEIEKHILRENSPSRLTSQYNLATYYWYLGRRNAAFDLMAHVVKIRRQVLDEAHPDRINAEEWFETYRQELHSTQEE